MKINIEACYFQNFKKLKKKKEKNKVIYILSRKYCHFQKHKGTKEPGLSVIFLQRQLVSQGWV